MLKVLKTTLWDHGAVISPHFFDAMRWGREKSESLVRMERGCLLNPGQWDSSFALSVLWEPPAQLSCKKPIVFHLEKLLGHQKLPLCCTFIQNGQHSSFCTNVAEMLSPLVLQTGLHCERSTQLQSFLRQQWSPQQLVVAADLWIYCGDLNRSKQESW